MTQGNRWFAMDTYVDKDGEEKDRPLCKRCQIFYSNGGTFFGTAWYRDRDTDTESTSSSEMQVDDKSGYESTGDTDTELDLSLCPKTDDDPGRWGRAKNKTWEWIANEASPSNVIEVGDEFRFATEFEFAVGEGKVVLRCGRVSPMRGDERVFSYAFQDLRGKKAIVLRFRPDGEEQKLCACEWDPDLPDDERPADPKALELARAKFRSLRTPASPDTSDTEIRTDDDWSPVCFSDDDPDAIAPTPALPDMGDFVADDSNPREEPDIPSPTEAPASPETRTPDQTPREKPPIDTMSLRCTCPNGHELSLFKEGLYRQLWRMSTEVTDHEKKCLAAERDARAARVKMATFEREGGVAAQELADVRAQLDEATERVAEERAATESVREKSRACEERIAALGLENEATARLLDLTKADLADERTAAESVREKIVEYEEAISVLGFDKDITDETLDQTKERLANVRAKLDEANERMAATESARGEAAAETIAAINREKEAATQELADVREQHEKATARIADQDTANEELNTWGSGLREKLAEIDAAATSLRDEIDARGKTIADMKIAAESAQDTIDAHGKTTAALDLEKGGLTRELADVREQHETSKASERQTDGEFKRQKAIWRMQHGQMLVTIRENECSLAKKTAECADLQKAIDVLRPGSAEQRVQQQQLLQQRQLSAEQQLQQLQHQQLQQQRQRQERASELQNRQQLQQHQQQQQLQQQRQQHFQQRQGQESEQQPRRQGEQELESRRPTTIGTRNAAAAAAAVAEERPKLKRKSDFFVRYRAGWLSDFAPDRDDPPVKKKRKLVDGDAPRVLEPDEIVDPSNMF